MLKILKRSGNVEPFDIKKIEKAIEKAFIAEHKVYSNDVIEMLALRTVSIFNGKAKNETIGVEDVQDAVEVALIHKKIPASMFFIKKTKGPELLVITE